MNYQTSNSDHPKQDQHDQKKTAAARRVHTQSTKSKQQERIEATQINTPATISSPGPKLSLKKLTSASKSTTSPRKKVSSNQDRLKRAHPTECCFIMKRKNGECHMKAKFHIPDLFDYLDGICLNSDPSSFLAL